MVEQGHPPLTEIFLRLPQELIDLDCRGFLAAPGESETQLRERADNTLSGINEFQATIQEQGLTVDGIQLETGAQAPAELIQPLFESLDQKFGIDPRWIPVYFIKHGLGMFGGGGMFSGTDENTGQNVTFFVLREAFRNKQKWLIYSRDEIMTHEFCHAARAGFNEPLFEEVVAYRSGTSAFRKYIGGAFRSIARTQLLLAFLALFWIGFFVQLKGGELWIQALLQIPMPLYIACLAFEGIYRQTQAEKTTQHLQLIFGQWTEAVLLRLSDTEIAELSRKPFTSPENLITWIAKRKDELRWQIIIQRFYSTEKDFT